VITQVLVKTPDGRGRRAILEILVNNRAIAKLITSDQTHQIPSQLQTGKDLGMQLLDQALIESIQARRIDPNDAIRYANDKKKFERFVTDTDLLPTLGLAPGVEG
jgi:twitching motility protein PilT